MADIKFVTVNRQSLSGNKEMVVREMYYNGEHVQTVRQRVTHNVFIEDRWGNGSVQDIYGQPEIIWQRS